ncbi:MAG TPA: ATP-binding cassette domain-containing protein [Chitinophagaceae bacterium]|nr:ATP-binding cassette domain-containing protein [Chitinophagaceae bacterium]
MRINCVDTGKRFNRDWIFRHFNYEFITGGSYAITGPNGSGKSTLLQVIAGAIAASEGKVEYTMADGRWPMAGKQDTSAIDSSYQHLSIAAPYLEVIEEMSVTEFLHFHSTFKPFLPGFTIPKIIEAVGLEQAAAHKQIRYYSSGMKQRVKLAQAIFSDVPCVLLDEPCTNLDAAGVSLYQGLVDSYCTGRLVIVSSNDVQEFSFCKERIGIRDYKS